MNPKTTQSKLKWKIAVVDIIRTPVPKSLTAELRRFFSELKEETEKRRCHK